MSSARRILTLAVCAAGLVLVLGACSDDGEGTLRIYSGRHYDLELAFEQFSSETGISVEFLTGSDAELRERIAAEGEDTQADVYLTVDASNLAVASDQGLLRSIDSPALTEAIPEQYRDPGGEWYALSLRARTVVYHPDRVAPDEVPTTYAELAEPRWEGRVCLRNSTNTYTQSLVASLVANQGRDEATRIVAGWADNADILPNDVIVLNSIAEGACDVGITNHYYLARLLEEDPDFPVRLTWVEQDDGGVHVNISGGGVTRFADDPELAQQFLEWLATDGQKSFADGNHEYPANPAVEPEPLIAAEFGTDFVQDTVNAGEVGRLNPTAVEIMDEVGYD